MGENTSLPNDIDNFSLNRSSGCHHCKTDEKHIHTEYDTKNRKKEVQQGGWHGQTTSLDISHFPLEGCSEFNNSCNAFVSAVENYSPIKLKDMDHADSCYCNILRSLAEMEDYCPNNLTGFGGLPAIDTAPPDNGNTSTAHKLENAASLDVLNFLMPNKSGSGDIIMMASASADASDKSQASCSSTIASNSKGRQKPMQRRIKPYQDDKWNLRYQELLEFIEEHGHTAVPHSYSRNPKLARWIKRQRCQYKLYQEGKRTNMTAERIEKLNSIKFIWNSREVTWFAQLNALKIFHKTYGHCDVPSNFNDKTLMAWVKCQRRQYKLYWRGETTAMTPERICELEKVGFKWEILMKDSNIDAQNHTLLQEAILEL